jgi:hypothetical protein
VEREKRPELTGTCPEVSADQTARGSGDSTSAQREAQENQGEKTAQIHALLRLERPECDGSAAKANSASLGLEIREVLDLWQTLSPEIRAAILAIVRTSHPPASH